MQHSNSTPSINLLKAPRKILGLNSPKSGGKEGEKSVLQVQKMTFEEMVSMRGDDSSQLNDSQRSSQQTLMNLTNRSKLGLEDVPDKLGNYNYAMVGKYRSMSMTEYGIQDNE